MAFRVFISSTMRDLDTERRLLRRKIHELNYEPVNAEDMPPTGASSWERIERELESCSVLVLIQGSRYGWVPESGPGARERKSVTHLEYAKARELDLPILVFQKVLELGVDDKFPDAAQRDAFRDEVAGWAQGHFLAKWAHGDELPELVAKALAKMAEDALERERIARRSQAAQLALDEIESAAPPTRAAPAVVPPSLVEAVATGRVLLFAGAGISLSAGLPSHALFAARASELIAARDREHVDDRSPFARLALGLDALGGRDELVQLVQTLLRPPGEIQPTQAHKSAVRMFARIVTSNYDELFEHALRDQRIEIPRFAEDLPLDALPERALVKLHGTMSVPESLLLTERDVALLDQRRPRMWRAVVETMRHGPTLIVGSSLRDPSIVRMLAEVGSALSGYVIAPRVTRTERAVLAQWGLDALDSDADGFFAALEGKLASHERH
jgi:hypothetical protein